MSGQFEQTEFVDAMLAGTGKTGVSIMCNAVLDDKAVMPNDSIKPCWCVSFLLMGNGFSISKVIQIATGKSGQKEAERIAEQIRSFARDYDTMKEALKFSLPDQCEIESSPDLTQEQKEILVRAKEIVNGDKK